MVLIMKFTTINPATEQEIESFTTISEDEIKRVTSLCPSGALTTED